MDEMDCRDEADDWERLLYDEGFEIRISMMLDEISDDIDRITADLIEFEGEV